VNYLLLLDSLRSKMFLYFFFFESIGQSLFLFHLPLFINGLSSLDELPNCIFTLIGKRKAICEYLQFIYLLIRTTFLNQLIICS